MNRGNLTNLGLQGNVCFPRFPAPSAAYVGTLKLSRVLSPLQVKAKKKCGSLRVCCVQRGQIVGRNVHCVQILYLVEVCVAENLDFFLFF